MAIIDDGGFGPVPEPVNPGDCSTELLVIAHDRAAVTRALRRVQARLGHVLYDGREVDDPFEPVYSDADLYTAGPFAPEQFVRGVAIGVDFKSEDLSAAMGATYREIVREELRRDGVEDASLALPDTSDRETLGEALFASVGVPSLEYRVELGPAVDAVLDHAPEGALLTWDAQFASPPMRAFLERHGRRDTSPLAYLSDAPMIPLDAEITAAFRRAAAVQDAGLWAPLWVVHDDHVLAIAWSSYGVQVRVRADADPRLIEAFAALHRERPRPAGPHVAEIEWAPDRAAARTSPRRRCHPHPMPAGGIVLGAHRSRSRRSRPSRPRRSTASTPRFA